MAETKIEWAHYTLNPWRGCTKVSEGCKNCYADKMSVRNPRVLGVWGPSGTRPVAVESYWRQPLKWNAEAQAAGEIRRVFCGSLMDIFEGEDTMPADAWRNVQQARGRLYDIIEKTPHLEWLLLTKRPENILPLINFEWRDDGIPSNIRFGTSVEDQKTAHERIPKLLDVGHKNFLSMEPLLGPVDLTHIQFPNELGNIEEWNALDDTSDDPSYKGGGKCIDWVIVGGESGGHARAMDPAWPRSIRDQCQAAGVPFLFKQWGEYAPNWLNDDDGNKIEGSEWIDRMGKKIAGRHLDGREWNEFPEVSA